MTSGFLGLDFGEKRIGVAVVPRGTTIAFPVCVIFRKGREQVLAEIKRLLTEHKAETLVVGLPKTLRGELGPAAEKLLKEIEWYRLQIQVPIVLWDERLSSKEAERILLDADVHREKRKEVIDQLAAQRILQNYVDAQIIKKNDHEVNR
ncbi:MAG TPA: Holliday junction resolvase RuvX [Candidatus Omnitrophota bacterium]|nr:Holliday junction resolvase RuvX [Candidatus Omnitrophota bacterium]